MIKINPAHPEPIRKSLGISWKEGIASEVMVWVVDYYMTAYGLFLGAGPKQIGFLVSIPLFSAAFSQFLVARLVKKTRSRLYFLRIGGLIQASVLVPVALLAFAPMAHRIPVLIGLMLIYRISQGLTDTVWYSLMSDYLPAHERPGYFGARGRVAGSAGVASMALAGILLFAMKGRLASLGFSILFLTASAARFISIRLLSRMTDMPVEHKPEHDFSFWMFIRSHRESNFVKYVFYSAATLFAVQLAAPYFSVHLLKNLKVDYLTFMVIQLSAVLVRLMALKNWGAHADKVGNAKILKLTTLLFPLIPLLWLFSSQLAYLILLQIFSGFVWAGYALCSTNFIYDAVSSGKRVRCVGYWTLMTNVGGALGAFCGGFLAEHLPPLLGCRILMLFLLSTLVRALMHFIFSRRFQEVRKDVAPVTYGQLLLSMLKLRPLQELSSSKAFIEDL